MQLLYNIFTELLFPCLPCAMTVAGTVFIAHGGEGPGRKDAQILPWYVPP